MQRGKAPTIEQNPLKWSLQKKLKTALLSKLVLDGVDVNTKSGATSTNISVGADAKAKVEVQISFVNSTF
jgi:hypothetical protein